MPFIFGAEGIDLTPRQWNTFRLLLRDLRRNFLRGCKHFSIPGETEISVVAKLIRSVEADNRIKLELTPHRDGNIDRILQQDGRCRFRIVHVH